jgi:hypothetical protein
VAHPGPGARRVGMAKVGDETIAAVRQGQPIADGKLEALRRFAARITRNRGVVTQADVDAFMKGAEWSAPGKLKAA